MAYFVIQIVLENAHGAMPRYQLPGRYANIATARAAARSCVASLDQEAGAADWRIRDVNNKVVAASSAAGISASCLEVGASMTDQTVSLDEAMTVLRQLRTKLRLPEERFSMPAFIGMISDEIEQMREAGHSDADTAAVIKSAIDLDLAASDIAEHYASPNERRQATRRSR